MKTDMKKVKLDYMVVPEKLAELAYVDDPVKVKITDSDAIFLQGILGESGRKLVKAGIHFYFTRKLADKLVRKEIAEYVHRSDYPPPPKRPKNMSPVEYYKKYKNYKYVDDDFRDECNGRYYCNPAHCNKSWKVKENRDKHLEMAYNALR